jgi:excinuclease ABC subunit C
VTFQRKRRAVRTVTSELLRIPGIGPVKRRQLLGAFGSIQGVRDATAEQIAALPGWTPKSAARVLDALRANSPIRRGDRDEPVGATPASPAVTER